MTDALAPTRDGSAGVRRPLTSDFAGLPVPAGALAGWGRRWYRAALALSGGLALYGAHPPAGWGWLGLVALVPLFALARDCARAAHPVRAGAGWGFLAGVAFLGPLLSWIAVVEAAALPLLVAFQALALAGFVAGLAAWGDRPWRPLAGVVWWVALEAVRSQWPLGGFPWGVLGYTQADGGVLLDVARAFGVLGVSAAAATVAAAVEHVLWLGGGMVRGRRSPRAVIAPAGVALIAVSAVFATAVGVPKPPAAGEDSLDLAAVQGNDIEDTRSLGQRREVAVAERMSALTVAHATSAPRPDAVVWPENSLDVDVTAGANRDVAAPVDRALDALGDTPLLAGLVRPAPDRDGALNTMARLNPDGSVARSYAKRSLVPFGEYVPFDGLVGWVPALERAGNFVAGDEPVVFDLDGAAVGTLICFENNFPGLARDMVARGAEALIVSTNNASFGRTAASDQHIAFSQLRAVETGRWVVHAGISGKSTVIAPSGAAGERTGLFEQAVVREAIPLIEGRTLFMRTGDLVGPAAMTLAAGGLAWLLASAVRRRHNGPASRNRPESEANGHGGTQPAGPRDDGARRRDPGRGDAAPETDAPVI